MGRDTRGYDIKARHAQSGRQSRELVLNYLETTYPPARRQAVGESIPRNADRRLTVGAAELQLFVERLFEPDDTSAWRPGSDRVGHNSCD